MRKLRVLDLFSGIAGMSLGLEWTGGFSTVAFCEIDPFSRPILEKNWPGVPIYEDVRTLPHIEADVVCGGFPCQDISGSGTGEGLDGERSRLWFEQLRVIGDVRPQLVIVENSDNLLAGNDGRWMGTILGGLASLGYDAEWHVISAESVGAPHRRNRVIIIAYPVGFRQPGQGQLLTSIHQAPDAYREAGWLVDAVRKGALPFVCQRHDGVPAKLARPMLHALGNAAVPHIFTQVGNAFLASIRESEAA